MIDAHFARGLIADENRGDESRAGGVSGVLLWGANTIRYV